MASPGELVKMVANTLGVPEATVVVHDRNLVKSGLRSKGGRGRSAAKVTAVDAANLLIAVAGTAWYHSGVKDTVATVREYAPLKAKAADHLLREQRIGRVIDKRSISDPLWSLKQLPITGLKELPQGHDFVQALTVLIGSASDGSLIEAAKTTRKKTRLGATIRVEIFGPQPLSTIKIRVGDLTESMLYLPANEAAPGRLHVELWEQWEQERRHDIGADLGQIRHFSHQTILAIGDLLRK